MAFAITSGVPPQAGIFTAVIASLGGIKVCIGGPTGAFIVILYGIYAKCGAANLAICTIIAGVMLLAMGLTRLSTMTKYIPYPVTMGYWQQVRRYSAGPADISDAFPGMG
jgi:SulP family sulfate permease